MIRMVELTDVKFVTVDAEALYLVAVGLRDENLEK